MQFFVGTSGYSYKEWKGNFYPEKISPKDMLRYYGERFSAVEINNTFYRLPNAGVLESWAREVPTDFRFILKASQKITHFKRLKGADDELAYLLRTASVLENRKGPMLFQLPPNLKKDIPRLSEFLDHINDGTRVAFEFRHASWLDDEVYECLRSHSCTLCVADGEELPATELVSTTNWGYLRLRREEYDDQALRDWLKKLRDQGWQEAYVFFKHEDAGIGPKLATRFLQLAAR